MDPFIALPLGICLIVSLSAMIYAVIKQEERALEGLIAVIMGILYYLWVTNLFLHHLPQELMRTLGKLH